jgi:hypothetical protein
MPKSKNRRNGTLASIYLVLPSRGVAKTLFLSILAPYFRRWRSTAIAEPAWNAPSRVEALSRTLGARQGCDFIAPTAGQALENQHDSQNTQSHERGLLSASREGPAVNRRIKTTCKALVPESSKRTPAPGATR